MSDPITAVAKAVEKLGRIGEMLLGPRTLREEAKAKAESIPIVTKAEIASDDLKVEAHRRRELEDVRHFTNLAAAFHDAKTQIEFLGAKKLLPENASQGESDPDWFHKWAGYAKETSDTDIRALWAKVLAGELVQPGRFSLRLLHCVSLFRKSEAQNFSLLANYFCRDQEGRILFLETRRTEDQLLKNVGIGASLFRSLENIGLLQRPKEPRGTPLYIQRSTVHYGEHAYTLKRRGSRRRCRLRRPCCAG